jgi:hypothetical protein
MAFLDKLKTVLSKNADKVDSAIDKAGDLVDKKTQGKYAQHVDKAQSTAKKAVQDNVNQTGQVPPTQQSGQVPPPQAPPGSPPQPQPPTAPPTS